MNRLNTFLSIAAMYVAVPINKCQAQSDTVIVKNANDSVFIMAANSINKIPPTVAIKDIEIKAYRADYNTPFTYKNLSKEWVQTYYSGQEPSKILSNTPAINSYSDAGNYMGYSYFRLRGIDQTRVNMTLDGIPLNEPEDQGVYFSNYPDFFNSIESIQIQRGVGTSSNGVASYAGSINFQSPYLKSDQGTRIGANYGSFNTYRIFGEYKNPFENDIGLYARVSHLSSDGYKYHSGNKSTSAFISSELDKDLHKFKFTAFVGQQENQLSWIGVPLDSLRKDSRINGNSSENDKFCQALVSLKHSCYGPALMRINSTIYYNYLKGNYDFDLNNFLGLPLSNEMYNYAFEHNFIGAFSNQSIVKKNYTLYSGVHVYMFNRKHIGSERNIGELYNNTGFKNEFSIFSKLNYKLGKIWIFGDLQYRYTSFDYSGSVDFQKLVWSFINPKGGIKYKLGSKYNLYYSIGTNKREPTRNDLFSGADDLATDSLGNPLFTNITPEQAYDHELGIRILESKWHLNANLYYMNFKNEIVLNGQYGPNGLPLHSNVANSFRSGVEVDFKTMSLFGFYYTNNSSWSYNRITENDKSSQPILSPHLIINQSIDYKKKNFHVRIEGKYQSESYIDFENSNKLPAFFESNLLLEYTFKALLFKTGINNISNAEILSNGYIGIYGNPLYFVQAPRNYFVSITWNL